MALDQAPYVEAPAAPENENLALARIFVKVETDPLESVEDFLANVDVRYTKKEKAHLEIYAVTAKALVFLKVGDWRRHNFQTIEIEEQTFGVAVFDHDRSYLKTVGDEQIEELKCALRALGVPAHHDGEFDPERIFPVRWVSGFPDNDLRIDDELPKLPSPASVFEADERCEYCGRPASDVHTNECEMGLALDYQDGNIKPGDGPYAAAKDAFDRLLANHDDEPKTETPCASCLRGATMESQEIYDRTGELLDPLKMAHEFCKHK